MSADLYPTKTRLGLLADIANGQVLTDITAGVEQLEPHTGRAPLAMVVRGRPADERDDLRKSHFASCPDAARWRREGRPA